MSDTYEIRPCPPEDDERAWWVERQVWAPFNWEADGAVGVDHDPDLHFVAYTPGGELVATIDGCGFDWDGDPATLPENGWTGIVLAAQQGFSRQPAYAAALGASILPAHRKGGLAGRLLTALRDRALELGYRGLVAPVRPSARWRMPHLSIEEYMRVRLPDGRHFDPWVRAHERIGGRIIGACAESAVFGGTREQWERWVGMRLPDNGVVICDHTIGPLELIDGYGILREDSLWLLHRPA
jgi:GNAT superfamily N-acetyltransferase